MPGLIRAAAARCDPAYQFTGGLPLNVISGGFAATTGPVLVPTAGTSAPLLWHRGSMYAAGLLFDLPPANSRGHVPPTFGQKVWWDAPYAWGRPGGVVKRPRFLWIEPLYSPSGSPDPANGPGPTGDWIDSVYESAFAPLNVSVACVFNRVGAPFLAGVPLSRIDVDDNGSFQTFSADTSPDLYTGGDVMVATIAYDRCTFGAFGAPTPWSDYAFGNYGSGSETGVRHWGTPLDGAVTFDAAAAAHLGVMNAAAAKCRRFGRFFYHQDVATPTVGDNAWDGIVGGNAYVTRRRFPAGDAAGLRATILADAAAFFA